MLSSRNPQIYLAAPSLCLGLALLLASCNSHEAKPSGPPLPRVRVERAVRGPIDEVVSVTGVLAAIPGRDVKLGALVPGRLARMSVAEGDAIKSGDVLAEIEPGPTSDELAQAEATAREAEAAEQAAGAKWKRTEELLSQGAASAQDAEQARASAVSARSTSARSKAAVDLARRRLTRTAIKAPFDGIVVAVLVRAGESVDGNGQPVLEVAATDPVELRAAAPPREAIKLRVGMPAKLKLEGLAVEREATVFAIAPAADAASGNVLVRIRATTWTVRCGLESWPGRRSSSRTMKTSSPCPTQRCCPRLTGGSPSPWSKRARQARPRFPSRSPPMAGRWSPASMGARM